MSTDADPQLLSLLEKIANPITQVNLQLNLKGVFAPPEQWKTTDQANPNIFGYSLEIFGKKFAGGKIQPKIGGEAASQVDDKNKKGGKNPVKEQEKPAELDPQALKKQKQLEALPEQQRFYRISQDPEKSFSLKFTQNESTELLQKQILEKFEQTVAEGSVQVILTRRPQISEDEIAKLKKSKPKTLNLGELYDAKYRGTLDLKELQVPGCQGLFQRVKLEFSGDLPADGVKIESQTAYALIQISVDKPLSPEVVEIKPQLQEVLPNIENLSKKSISVIQKLKKEITRAIKAINQEYIQFFSKQKDFVDDKKLTGLNSISTLRLNQINKRKDIFLNEFLNNGKFAILKERISLVLKAIIVDKFRKQKTAGPISKEQIHRTLSELNVFFQQFVADTIDYVLTKENSVIHEDILLNHETSKSSRQQSVAPVVSESKQQKQARIAEEYETINNVKEAQEKYLNLVLLHNQSIQSLEKYANFLIKNHKFDSAYEIYKKINKKSTEFNHRFILCLFMVQRRRIKQVLKVLTEMIESDQILPHLKYLSTNCLSFMYEQENDILRSEKYLALSQKYFQLHKNPQLKINPALNPYSEPKPLIPKPQRYTSVLSQSQTQEMWSSFTKYLEQNHFYDLLAKMLPKIVESNRKKILSIKVSLFNGKYQQCLDVLDNMLEKEPKNLDLLDMKADICFRYEKIFECQEVFLLILKQKPSHTQSYKAFLRLGYTYLSRKSWQDAKSTFEKVCELKNNSSVAWLGLGIALLELGKLKQGEEAFSMSSIYNPLSQEAKLYLRKINETRNKENLANYKYLESYS